MFEASHITLNYTAENLRHLYFGRGAGDIWNYPDFRIRVVFISVALLAVVVFNLMVTHFDEPRFLVIVILSVLLMIWKAVEIIIQIWRFLKWKRTVKQFVKKLDGTTETIEWTQQAFTYTNIDETKVVRWQEVRQVQIFPTHVTLTAAKDIHTFFAIGMEPGEFHNFCNVLRTAVSRDAVGDD